MPSSGGRSDSLNIALAPGATVIAFSALSARQMSATPLAACATRVMCSATPASRSDFSISGAKASSPNASTMRVATPPASAQATAWFAPLPPGTIASSRPSTVSPGAGTWCARTTKSRLADPATRIASRGCFTTRHLTLALSRGISRGSGVAAAPRSEVDSIGQGHRAAASGEVVAEEIDLRERHEVELVREVLDAEHDAAVLLHVVVHRQVVKRVAVRMLFAGPSFVEVAADVRGRAEHDRCTVQEVPLHRAAELVRADVDDAHLQAQRTVRRAGLRGLAFRMRVQRVELPRRVQAVLSAGLVTFDLDRRA